MIDGILLSLCIVAGVYSRKLYCDSERELNEGMRTFAITLDIASLSGALLILVFYWDIIPGLN